MQHHNRKRLLKAVVCVILSLLLAASIGMNIYFLFFHTKSYLQDVDEIYIMESGILKNNLEFDEGTDYTFTYDFDNEEYPQLIQMYQIDQIAGNGTEFQKAMNLMNEFAPRLAHQSDYDNSVDMNALDLLAYSLDKREHGINCRNKAQILNEMCLALGIYSRKVWIMPNSKYDNDCHVVNEVWDTVLHKWVMLDITNNQYWVDENGHPLSVIEIRTKGANQEFCTPVTVGEKLENLTKLKERHISGFLYIMKNMVYMQYCDRYSVGESENQYLLFPETLNTDYEYIISQASCERSPMN